MLEHGGRLHAASQQYGIAREHWLDLSTGINPLGWPLADLSFPPAVWARLPEDDDALLSAAAAYYGTPSLLAVAGSQAALQILPSLRPPNRVGLPDPAYAEHAKAWRQGGHELVPWCSEDGVEALDVLVLIHPNNPSGQRYSRAQLLAWHASLAARGGWLVVDEAFIDATPHDSLTADCPQEGLIVLRSLGKFFGLAGARVGFVAATASLLDALRERLGPWTIAGPSRWVAQHALADHDWHVRERARLSHASEQLAQLLRQCSLAPDGGTALFQWVCTPHAVRLHHHLAQRGVLVRAFTAPSSVRFGLPAQAADWARLRTALEEFS